MSKARTQALIGSVLGLENEEGEGTLDGTPVSDEGTTEVVEVEPLSTEGTEAEAVAEVVEGEAEVEAVADEVETMQENVEALEALAADLQAAIKDGGMTPQAAVMFNRAHVAIAGRHLNIGKRVLAAESFGSASSRLRATETALESVMESIKAFIKGIIEFVKKIAAKVVAWFKSVFTAKGRLLARLKNLETAVANMGSELKDKSAKIAYPEGLTLDGKPANATQLTSAMEFLVNPIKNVKPVQAFNDMVDKVVDTIKSADSADKLMAAALTTLLLKVASNFATSNSGTFDTDALNQSQVGIGSPEMPGSKCLLVTVPKAGGAASEISISTLLGAIDLKIVNSKPKLKMSDKLETPAWSSGELVKLLGVTKDIAESDSLKDNEHVQKVVKAVDDVLNDIIKVADKEAKDAPALAANARAVATGLQGVVSRVGRSAMGVESYAFQRAQAAANLIAAHVKAYK